MSVVLAGGLRIGRALKSRPFALLWTGEALSTIGDGAFTTALAWTVLQLTGSSTAMGLVVMAQALPRVVFVLLGGVAADRVSPRLVMLASDAVRAVLTLAVAFLAWFNMLQLWHLIALMLVFGVVSGFFYPAYSAIVPRLVDGDDLLSANALKSLTFQMSDLFGPLLGAALLAVHGSAVAFAFDGVTFCVSAACLFRMDLPAPGSGPIASDSAARGRARRRTRAFARDLGEGLRYVAGSQWLWVSIIVAALTNIGSAGPVVVALPKLVGSQYGAGVWLLGWLATANACGAIAATFVMGHMRRPRRRGLLAYTALAASGLALAALAAPLPRMAAPLVACVALAAFGFCIATFGIIWETVMQELIPTDKLGRVSSVDMLGSFSLLPLGYALTGFLSDRIGPAWVFAAGGAAIIGLSALALSVPTIRRTP